MRRSSQSDNNNKNNVVVFQRRKPFVSELYDTDPNIRSLCQIAFTSLVFTLLANILSDSIKAGRFHWEIFDYIELPTLRALLCAIQLDLLYHLSLLALYPTFQLWRRLRSSCGNTANIFFIFLYSSTVLASFGINIWTCIYFDFPKYFRIALTVEQVRACMKSYSFVRENAYKVLYPWHKDDTSGPAQWYQGQMSPSVGSFKQYCYFLFAPTLLYRDHYPRYQGSISWKTVCINFGLFIVGLTVALQIYTKMQINDFRWINAVESFVTTLPASLVFLSMGTTSTMHGWMNMWAELMKFSDRRYYEDWWCSSTHQEYYRKWNIIPYHFNRQYLYTDIRKVIKSPVFAMFILILASSLIHEYILSIAMGFFLPVLTVLFSGIGVIVVKCRLKGGFSVLLSLFFGFHMMTWTYFMEIAARRVCAREETLLDIFYPRAIECFQKHNNYL